MDTVQQTHVMKSDYVTSRDFIGVFPADYIDTLEITSYPSALIVNTDDSTAPGQHWVSIYFDQDRSCEFFCSFGNPPWFYNETWANFISRWSRGPQRYNNCIVQHKDSFACGAHCCYILYHRCHGVSFKDILDSYDNTNLRWNDKIVEEDVENHLDIDIIIHRSNYMINQICRMHNKVCI